MSLKISAIEDYFLIAWNEKITKIIFDEAKKFSKELNKRVKEDNFDENFSLFSSILLIASSKNIDKLLPLKTYNKAYHFLSKEALHVKIVQVGIFLFLGQKRVALAEEIILHVKQLEQNGIGEITHFEALEKVFGELKSQKEEKTREASQVSLAKSEEPKTYKEYVSFFEAFLKELSLVVESNYLQKRVNNVKEKLDNASFSIGITGVMNAGKSTMLNALLGKEILGTSVVPETANLTLIKYAKEPYAKVNFWNKTEWQEIEKSAKFLPSIDKFVQETKESFKNELSSFIEDETKSQEIDISALPFYTSAKHSELKCNLVKSVELYTNLEFVKDGVSIVDTPGLDDPVIQREEITKKYLSHCDIMVHLMNANQSATQKDVEFIIDSLTYQHISGLLIVITRIDTITSEELEEVIAYTKQSIYQRLKEANQEAGFDKIVSKIKFLPIAGKLALMHRTNRANEALQMGYPLEKTGILEIEQYLSEVLFGKESQKATLLIDGAKKEIQLIFKEAIEGFCQEEQNLSTTAKGLREKFDKKSTQNEKNYKELEKIEELIEESQKELESFFTTLSNFLKIRIEKLKAVAISRVVDDCSYEARKNKAKPTQVRVVTMIETTMKDGIIDLVRDYRYEFYKKVTSKMEAIAQVSTLFQSLEQTSGVFDAKEFFEASFGKGFLNDSYAVVNQRAYEVVKNTKRGDMETLSVKLETIFKEAMESTLKKLHQSIDEVNGVLLGGFLQKVQEPIDTLKHKMSQEEEELLSQIAILEGDEAKVKERLDEIVVKKEKLQLLHKTIFS